MEAGKRRISPAMVVALVALVASLMGTAYAAVGKNSVGTRQLKSKAVTAGKLAKNSVTGSAVRNGTLTGADINLGALGTVPEAQHAASADNSGSVGGHAADCPAGTTLIRGVCFDAALNSVAADITTAADSCASKGGYLPGPMEIYSTRSILNLGDGTGSNWVYTDTYYNNTTSSGTYSTVVVDGKGEIKEQAINSPARYICAYPLVR